MTGERDEYGILINPAEQYQEFMLSLYDLEALAEELEYSKEARDALHKARLSFMAEFKARHPGFGTGRAVWE
ncbi:hypothetical protein JQ604_25685 [Bradyrhizobium jicamae]|uniref:hypothetical protein n=1 Tax=Bradyrhizobium jicamae TaxID=280332 RepID=UPI001BAC8AEF|nr:hypothetical protein [Bradyrhizobium jicamae]MBR0755587.1 hypothetical protein [Bradyrhizobium jicamae]